MKVRGVCGLGIGVWGLGFWDWGFGFRMGFGFRSYGQGTRESPEFGFAFSGLRSRRWGMVRRMRRT